MRAWLACLLASGCYLQPTVFEGGATVPVSEPPPPPVVDAPVGCVTQEPGIRRVRPTKWWLGDRRVTLDDVERALAASPDSAAELARARRDHRLALGLWLAGIGIAIGSFAGMVAWIHTDEQSREPLVMLAPGFSGYALGFASVPLAIRGDHERRRAIDAFNEAAARTNRCPP
jgi:hypothetical protein